MTIRSVHTKSARVRFLAACLLAICVMFATPNAAQSVQAYDKLARGPKIGAQIPHNLATLDQNGALKNFTSLTGKNGLILLFSRSVGWCVYCKTEAVDWNKRLKDAQALGYNVAIITYDQIKRSALFSNRQNIKYPILSDPKSRIIKSFGILNENHEPGSFAYGIPHPIIFVVDDKGIIKHRFSQGTNYRARPEIDLILNILRHPKSERRG